jgi:hypothetical protein
MNFQKNIPVCLTILFCFAFANLRIDADEVLIDRPPDFSAGGVRDIEVPDFPDFSLYVVADVIFDTDVQIDSISTYFTYVNLTWPQNEFAPAVLNVFEGELGPDDDPRNGTLLQAFYVGDKNGIEVFADLTTPLSLEGGVQYWIGLTPSLEFGEFGSEFHFPSQVGPNSMVRNPGGGLGLGTDWADVGKFYGIPPYSAAITIRGNVVPEPSSTGLLFLAVALFGTRGRRRH